MARNKRQAASAVQEANTPPAALMPKQSIARVTGRDGGNVYTCELPNQKTVTVELADRFHKSVWVRNGGFVLVEAYATDERGGRIQGQIVNVVGDETSWRKKPYWPQEFPKLSDYDDMEDEDSIVGKMPPSDSEDE